MKNKKNTYPLWNKSKTIGSDDLQITGFKPAEQVIEHVEIITYDDSLKLPFVERIVQPGKEDTIIHHQ